MDLFGPLEPVSLSGKKCSLVVDDYLRHTWTIFMTKKKETQDKLFDLMRKIQNVKGLSIVKIRSDRGTKFTNRFIEKYYSDQ